MSGSEAYRADNESLSGSGLRSPGMPGKTAPLPSWLQAKRTAVLKALREAVTPEDKDLARRAGRDVLAQIQFWREHGAEVLAFRARRAGQ